jgi:hypothetical protein
VRGRRCLGRPFYRRPREGGGQRSSAGAGEVHNAGINAAQRRRRDLTAGVVPGKDVVKRRGRGGAELSCAARGRRWRGRWCVVREEDDEAADWWGWSASERERARGSGWQVGPARQRERGKGARSGYARAGAGRQWVERGGSAGARGRGGSRGMGRIHSSRGESFLFFLLFSNSHFHFCFFSF